MLSVLSDKFESIFSKLGIKKRLSEANIEEGIKEIRLALIEADVNLSVIKSFIGAVKVKALGTEVTKAVSPYQMFVKVVYDELVEHFGGREAKELSLKEPTRLTHILLCGLQGSGKTTTCAKLARQYKEKRDLVMVSLDIYRPAANEQLKQLAQQVGVTFYDRGQEKDLKSIIKGVHKFAKKNVKNMIIYDTAGRTQLDKEMLDELKKVHSRISPAETILVCDAMTGQQALTVATQFKNTVPLTSLIFTKFDSDTRGGAVLSVKHVVGCPVKYIGIGEGVSELDHFDPERIADRILGKGDIVGLVNKAQEVVDEEKAEKLAKKMAKNEFDLQDFMDQLQQLSKMGSMESLLSMIPGMGKMAKNIDFDEKEFIRMSAIIQSMTKIERIKPFMLNNSRKMRVAKGSGSNLLAVNQLLKKYDDMKKMMKKMKNPMKMKNMMEQATGAPFDMQGLENKLGSMPGMNMPGASLSDNTESGGSPLSKFGLK